MTETKQPDEPQELSRWHQPLEHLSCVNEVCPSFGQKGAGNLQVRKGKGSRWRILRCSACMAEFSERRGTPLFASRLAPEKFVSVASHLKEGVGVRATARLCGVSTGAVTRVAVMLGIHARALHELLAQNLEASEIQMDEKWGFLKKSKKTPARPKTKKPGTETSGIT